LRREEALKKGSKPVRTFTSGKGEKAREEVVYKRADVYVCRTVENWYKEGKKVKVINSELSLMSRKDRYR
jgi:xeroderma pigmentosum group C-complementing protein